MRLRLRRNLNIQALSLQHLMLLLSKLLLTQRDLPDPDPFWTKLWNLNT